MILYHLRQISLIFSHCCQSTPSISEEAEAVRTSSPQIRESDETHSLRRRRRPPSSEPPLRRPRMGKAIVCVHSAGCAKRPGVFAM